MDPRLEPILHRTPTWLENEGPEGDVVVSSRVRQARNLAQIPFPRLISGAQAQRLCGEVEEVLAPLFRNGLVLNPNDLDPAEAEFLIERSLATRDLVESSVPTRVLFLGDGTLALMVNEEDHFRVQGFAAGLDLNAAHQSASKLTEEISCRFRLARHSKYGYLTACPTNVGSGMRASLMLHLPALARATQPLHQMIQVARRANLAVRGVHGEGSRALGNLYQISNQITLGVPAKKQVGTIESFGRELIEYERRERTSLLHDEGAREALVTDATEAFVKLSAADAISTAEALTKLSVLRLALLAGIGDELGIDQLHSASQVLTLCFQLQPGHLQARFGQSLDPARRDRSRAILVRRGLTDPLAGSDPEAEA
ncbi:MAG: ATP--guanido phosphotransferase [Planctomycetes bacterium]|nr:ATP--guanido phosphotransferase [Planctomycetota bacterium]